jgi:hypothetical protein
MSSLKSNNEFDSLEAFFNKRFTDASLEPENSTWMKLEEELNKLEKEKRKRRFIWFFSSGLLLVCGLASLWFFMPQNTVVANQKSEVKSEKKAVAGSLQSAEIKKEETQVNVPEIKTNETIAEANNNTIEKTKEKKNTTEIFSSQKIQLGAFKHKADLAAFNKIPYKVIEVNSKDGYTKYYAEANTKETDALAKIHEAGFSGAFIKKDFNESDERSVVKAEGVIETSSPVYIAAKSNSSANDSYSGSKQNTKTTPPVAVVSVPVKVNAETKVESNPIVVKTENTNATTGTKTPAVVETKQDPPVSETKETKTPVAEGTKKEETKTPITENQTPVVTTKTDSVITTPVASAETKKDSTAIKAEKKDSVITPPKIAAIDSSKKNPFIPEWTLAFLGGPNIFSATSQSSFVTTMHETQNTTYNGEAKLSYRPFKLISFSGGMNFTSYTAQQDATYFTFNRYQTDDFQFYSSFGSMGVPMKTMLEGFSPMAPFSTFFAKYAYTTTLQTLNVPIEANIHFLNTNRVRLYLGIGGNSSFAIAQSSHLSLIKENSTTDFSYNNVTANKFNFLLVAGLGCDIRVTKHWFITLNPAYKYGITNMSGVNGTTYKPAFFSANGGIKFKF